jgi:hypothetical protein
MPSRIVTHFICGRRGGLAWTRDRLTTKGQAWSATRIVVGRKAMTARSDRFPLIDDPDGCRSFAV